MLKRAHYVLLPLFAIAVYLFIFRGMYYKPTSTERSDAGTDPWIQKGFTVAVVWPPHADLSLVEGVKLAAEEVNAGGGPLANKINLKFYTETSDRGALAREIVKQKDLVAVIGHELEGTTIPASVTYNEHGVLFLSPKNTDVRLTSHQFQFVFRLTPDDRAMTKAIADFAMKNNWKRVGIIHGRNDRGNFASAQFLVNADKLGMTVPFMHSFFHEPAWYIQDFRPMIAEVRATKFDAVMLADELPWTAKLLVDMASMGLTEPVIGTDKLDSMELWQWAKTASNGVYIVSAVNPESTELAFQSFRERFRKRFNVNPGYGASQGYETFMLYVNACLASNDADPLVVATTLRTKKWNGLFGEFSFTQDGDVVGRDISIKQMKDGAFRTVLVFKEN